MSAHPFPHLAQLAVLAIGGLLFVLGNPAWAETAELLWIAPGIENVVCLEAIEDIDGDGGPDIVFESYDAGAPHTDHLICIRGASSGAGEVIWGTRPEGGVSSGGGYGDNCMRIAPDITGDGVQDVLLGTAWGGRSAYVLDGTQGDNIEWMFDTYADSPPSPPTSGWVYAMDAVDDLNGDSVPEVTFCAGNYNQGVYMMDGASGDVLWYYDGGAPFFDVRCVGDVDGDGFADVCASSGDGGPMVICFKGQGTGSGLPDTFWVLDYPNTVMCVRPLESIDDDDHPEIVTACWDGRVRCHDGETGAEHWASGVLASVVHRVAVVGDVNDDGIDDIIAGLWDHKVTMLSGLDGGILWNQFVGTLNGGDTWAVDGAGDVNFDGVPEVAVGSFDTKAYLMDGVDGTILWEYSTGNRVMTIRGVPDLNGNGVPDVVAGTQRLSSGGFVFALEGQPPSAGVGEHRPVDGLAGFSLEISPNPLTTNAPMLAWRLRTPRAGHLQLHVVSADGRRVRTLLDRQVSPSAQLNGGWDRRDAHGQPVPGGVFWLRAQLGGHPLGSRRVTVLR